MSKEALALIIMVVTILGMTAFAYRNRRRSATSHETDEKIFRTAPRWAGRINEKLDELKQQIGREARADERRDIFIMGVLEDAADKLEANTTAIDGAAASAESAFTRLAQMIADLKTNTTDPATVARIDALSTMLAARAASLGAAVEATPT